jgi:hypothetical protein
METPPLQVVRRERRATPRYDVSVPIEFYGHRGRTRNVSQQGICFETDQWLPTGDTTSFLLVFRDFGGFPSQQIAGSGEVVRVEECGGRFVIALRVTAYALP